MSTTSAFANTVGGGSPQVSLLDTLYKAAPQAAASAGTGALAGLAAGPWGVVAGGALGAAGTLAGSAINYYGAREANRMNIELAREQNAFASAEAQKSRDWSKEMSNTSFQRAMNDARAAGVNPIYALGAGGASTPAASVAQGGRAHSENALAGAVNSAVDITRAFAQLERTRADVGLTNVLTKHARAELPAKEVRGQVAKSPYGRAVAHLSPIASLAGDVIHSAVGLKAARTGRMLAYDRISNSILRSQR